MNELYQDKLSILAEDEVMLQAIKAVFNKAIEKPIIDKDDNNMKIGEKYRAYDESKKILNQVFLDIDSYKKEKVESENTNRGQ